jgi:diguanylate cyclase (GGDEF)-like protein
VSDKTDALAVPLRATPLALRCWLAGCVVVLIAGLAALTRWAPGPALLEIVVEPGAILLLVLILLADIYPTAPWMRHSEVLDQFIMSTPLAIAALMVFGPHAAVFFVVAGIVMSAVMRPVWWRVLLNGALWGLQGLLAAAVMMLITGPFTWDTPMTSLAMIPVTLALAVVIESSNILLVGTSWWLAGAVTWREYFADWHSQIAVGALALTAPIPAVIAQVYPGLLPLLALAMVAAQSGMKSVASRTALASTDPLTSLANRVTLMDRITVRLGQLRQPGDTVTLLLVDLDRFKDINDRYGHLAGDRVLVEVARRLEESTRSADLVARFGGDEFAVLLAGGVSHRSVAEVADRITAAIGRPIQVQERTLLVGSTVGSTVAVDRSVSALQLVQRADADLYRAKSARPVASGVPAGPADRVTPSPQGSGSDGPRRLDREPAPSWAATAPVGRTRPLWSLTGSSHESLAADGAGRLTHTRSEQ